MTDFPAWYLSEQYLEDQLLSTYGAVAVFNTATHSFIGVDEIFVDLFWEKMNVQFSLIDSPFLEVKFVEQQRS